MQRYLYIFYMHLFVTKTCKARNTNGLSCFLLLVFLRVLTFEIVRKTNEKSGGKMLKETRYIEEETGELRGKNVRYIASSFDEEKGYLFWARKGFAKSFLDIDFPPETTMKERGQMATLAKKIWSNTNMLGYRGNGGIRPYNEKQIGEVIELKEYQAKKFVRKMIDLGIMAKVNVEAGEKKEVHFYVNPIYFFSSNRIPLNLYLIFRNQLDCYLPDWVKAKYAETKK